MLFELDQKRQTMLLERVQNKVQTFITTCFTGGIEEFYKGAGAIWQVSSGNLTLRRKYNVFAPRRRCCGVKKDVIAILDSRTKQSVITREFIEVAKDEGFIQPISNAEKEKSFVITNKEIFISPISCTTLKKRSDNILESQEDE
nr:extracellular matrix/biofilm biosynthesis regulator RemA family protein [Desulforamulus aquiferis]